MVTKFRVGEGVDKKTVLFFGTTTHRLLTHEKLFCCSWVTFFQVSQAVNWPLGGWWNDPPLHLVSSPSLEVNKNRLDVLSAGGGVEKGQAPGESFNYVTFILIQPWVLGILVPFSVHRLFWIDGAVRQHMGAKVVTGEIMGKFEIQITQRKDGFISTTKHELELGSQERRLSRVLCIWGHTFQQGMLHGPWTPA